MIGARVLPDDQDEVGLLEVLQFHRPLTDAQTLDQRRPRDSWHMLEQSGRLFVPNCLAKSW